MNSNVEEKHLFQKVLLVEDDASHAVLASRAISKSCQAVEMVDCAKAALEALAKGQYDLIVTDLHLPDASGAELVGMIKSNANHLPIIVLTASTSLSDAIAALKHGARDFLVKDFHPEFANVLRHALKRIRGEIDGESERVRLQGEMELFRRAIDNSSEGFALIGRDGAVQYANVSLKGFLKLCGVHEDNVLSLAPGAANVVRAKVESLSNKIGQLTVGASWQTELVINGPDRELAYKVSVSAVGIARSEVHKNDIISGLVMWVRDVSDTWHREKFQKEILSTTTHDLKGPLGAIIISSEMLAEMVKGQGKAHDLALRIGSSAHGAVNLIEEFLSARRIQEGSLILRPAEFDAKQLIEDGLESFLTIATARGIDLKMELDADLGKITVDRLGFLRVLSNLLSNALKFTPRGGAVTVRMRRVPGGIRLDVADTGSGMEPSELKKIFERFGRLDRHREVDGTGLGLFVVKCVVAAHGGSVEVTSKVGEGTTFTLTLPEHPPVNERGELISLDFA